MVTLVIGAAPVAGNATSGDPRAEVLSDLSAIHRLGHRAVSDKMLIPQQKEVDGDGIVKRTDGKEVPSSVDCKPRPLGRSP